MIHNHQGEHINLVQRRFRSLSFHYTYNQAWVSRSWVLVGTSWHYPSFYSIADTTWFLQLREKIYIYLSSKEMKAKTKLKNSRNLKPRLLASHASTLSLWVVRHSAKDLGFKLWSSLIFTNYKVIFKKHKHFNCKMFHINTRKSFKLLADWGFKFKSHKWCLVFRSKQAISKSQNISWIFEIQSLSFNESRL